MSMRQLRQCDGCWLAGSVICTACAVQPHMLICKAILPAYVSVCVFVCLTRVSTQVLTGPADGAGACHHTPEQQEVVAMVGSSLEGLGVVEA